MEMAQRVLLKGRFIHCLPLIFCEQEYVSLVFSRVVNGQFNLSRRPILPLVQATRCYVQKAAVQKLEEYEKLCNAGNCTSEDDVVTDRLSLKSIKTPMMRQYLRVKEKYANYLVLFRVGDFYEIFFEDALRASQALDLTVTFLSL